MLNPLNFFSKLLKSSNQKELDKLKKIIIKINKYEDQFQNLDKDSFPSQTNELITKISEGKKLVDGALLAGWRMSRWAAISSRWQQRLLAVR